MNRNSIEAIVLSDTHLGSGCCEIGLLWRFAHWLRWPGWKAKLYLVGDITDSCSRRLGLYEMAFLETLAEYGKATGARPLWIPGNHDRCDEDRLCQYVEKCSEWHWVNHSSSPQSPPVMMSFRHGDWDDTFVRNHPVLTEIAGQIHSLVGRFSRAAAGKLKRACKSYLHVVEALRGDFVSNFLNWPGDSPLCGSVLFKGHSHHPEIFHHGVEGRVFSYVNTGSWTEGYGWFATVERCRSRPALRMCYNSEPKLEHSYPTSLYRVELLDGELQARSLLCI